MCPQPWRFTTRIMVGACPAAKSTTWLRQSAPGRRWTHCTSPGWPEFQLMRRRVRTGDASVPTTPTRAQKFFGGCRFRPAVFVVAMRRGRVSFFRSIAISPIRAFVSLNRSKEIIMAANDTFLAVFLGSKTSPRMKAWMALPEGERRAKEKEGIAAWMAWAQKHQAVTVGLGGPLGKTKKITR